jgi:hypothetical protein
MAAGHKTPGNGWNSDDRHGQQGESTRHHGESGGNMTSHMRGRRCGTRGGGGSKPYLGEGLIAQPRRGWNKHCRRPE